MPFVVISKTDYEREAVEATVFWDNAFASEVCQNYPHVILVMTL